MLTDPTEIKQHYRRWQRRVLIASIIGYAMFYFVRKNLSIAMPVMEKSLGITKTDLGLFLTLHGLLYGLSKFGNGFLGDRCNARTFMAFGLALSAVVNIFFRIEFRRVDPRVVVDVQRLGAGHRVSALRPVDDPLVFPQGTGHQFFHLEHVAFHRSGVGGGAVRVSGEHVGGLAALFLRARRPGHSLFHLPALCVAGYPALRGAAGSGGHRATGSRDERIFHRAPQTGVHQQIHLVSLPGEFLCLYRAVWRL
jgi:hypothetical protein